MTYWFKWLGIPKVCICLGISGSKHLNKVVKTLCSFFPYFYIPLLVLDSFLSFSAVAQLPSSKKIPSNPSLTKKDTFKLKLIFIGIEILKEEIASNSWK